MPIDFYYLEFSPPCRSVLLLAKAIGVHLNLKTISPMKGEHMKSEFVKLNPQHVIPTIDDNGFVLCESRPIMGYLVSKYAKNDSLYPKDPKRRGIVDQMLYFDIGTLNENVVKCYYSTIFLGAHSLDEENVRAVERSCEVLNAYLGEREYVAGDTFTIADFAIHTTICVLLCLDFDIDRYDNLATWYNSCRKLLDKFGFDAVHASGTKLFADLYRANLQESS